MQCRIRSETDLPGTGVEFSLEGVALRPKRWHTHLHCWSGSAQVAAASEPAAADSKLTQKSKKKKKATAASSGGPPRAVTVNLNVVVDRVSETKAPTYE